MCCCVARIIQILLFVFNFIFVVAGLAVLVLGVITKLGLDEIVPENFSGAVTVAPILLITVGCIVFVVAFLGCCGAMKRSVCLLIPYAAIIVCIIIMQVSAGVFALTSIKEGDEALKEEVDTLLSDAFKNYGENKAATEYIDNVQQALTCCGVLGPSDWNPNRIPKSCYEDNNSNKDIFEEGCLDFLYDNIVELLNMIGKVALGLCVAEVLTVIFAVCLICS